MNNAEQNLLTALKKSLWQTNVSFTEDIDWDAVLDEADKQAVLGLVIDVAPSSAREKWISKAGATIAHYVRILHHQDLLYRLMAQNGIPIAFLKGVSAAIYYPSPSKRSMGDIDFIVPKTHYETANQILLDNGFSFISEHSEKRHKSYLKDGISFELHYHFSYEDIDIESFIEEGLQHIEMKTVDNMCFPMLPKLANGLVLLAHMLHHFKTAVGLRQVIDWMMFVNAELDDPFWEEEFKTSTDHAGLTMAACVVTRLCQIYLGLSDEINWCKSANQVLCKELLENFIYSGNFGRKMKEGVAVEVISSSLRKEGIFHHLQTKGEMKWGAYKKHKCLRPFAWIYQACFYFRKGVLAKHRGTHIFSFVSRGRKREKLYKKLKIGQSQ